MLAYGPRKARFGALRRDFVRGACRCRRRSGMVAPMPPVQRLARLAGLVLLLAAAPAHAAPPPNDDFAAAQTLTTSLSGHNAEATRDADEPDHHGDAGHSVWYAYTPASTGHVSIDVCDAAFQGVVAVYTGTSLASLAQVAQSAHLGC